MKSGYSWKNDSWWPDDASTRPAKIVGWWIACDDHMKVVEVKKKMVKDVFYVKRYQHKARGTWRGSWRYIYRDRQQAIDHLVNDCLRDIENNERNLKMKGGKTKVDNPSIKRLGLTQKQMDEINGLLTKQKALSIDSATDQIKKSRAFIENLKECGDSKFEEVYATH